MTALLLTTQKSRALPPTFNATWRLLHYKQGKIIFFLIRFSNTENYIIRHLQDRVLQPVIHEHSTLKETLGRHQWTVL